MSQTAAVPTILRQTDVLQSEIASLQQEITLLRRRDDVINYYMNRVDEELRLAAKLQRDFLPKTLPQIGRVQFHSLYRPAGYVSGDIYDVTRLDEDHVAFYVADAVGHGIPAALLTMFVKRATIMKEIEGNSYRLLTPAQTMSGLNAALVEQNLSQATFATALYGLINVRTCEVRIAVGGHPAPILIKRDGTLSVLPIEGSLLGVFPDEQYEDKSVQLAEGDRLFIYTDGVEVAFSEDVSLDSQRWRDELLARKDMPTEDLIADLTARLDQESGSIEPKDDLTMIVVEVAAGEVCITGASK
jgi:sigma-B regulation protein RsbU (phosphoserine phosphatase)